MESLEKRKSFREKQRAREQEEREFKPAQSDEYEGDGEFDAGEWSNDTVENIKANLGDLSDDEIEQVEQAEKTGKNRTGVLDALATERNKRTATGANWKAQ